MKRNDHIMFDDVKDYLTTNLPNHPNLLSAFEKELGVKRLGDAVYAALYFNGYLGGNSHNVNLNWLEENIGLLHLWAAAVRNRVFNEIRNSRPWLPPYMYSMATERIPTEYTINMFVREQMNSNKNYYHFWTSDLANLLVRYYRSPEFRDEVTFYRIPSTELLALPFNKRITLFGATTPHDVEEMLEGEVDFEYIRPYEEHTAFTSEIPSTAIGYHVGPVAAPALMALLSLCGSPEDALLFKGVKRVYPEKTRCKQLETILQHILDGEEAIAEGLLPLFENAHACGTFKYETAISLNAKVNPALDNNYDCMTGKSIQYTYLELRKACERHISADKSFSMVVRNSIVETKDIPMPNVRVSDVLGGGSKERILPFYEGIYTIDSKSLNNPSLLAKGQPPTNNKRTNRGKIPTL